MSFDLSKMIKETVIPQETLLKEARALMPKWAQSGLLEGLKNDVERGAVAVLLENQARQLVVEHSRTGTAANAEQWTGVALPLVRKVFGEIAAKEFMSVQPMNLPNGLVFFLDFKYGTAVAPRTVGESLYGNTSQSNGSPTGGFYGAGRHGYSINDVTMSFTAIAGTGATTDATINYNTSILSASSFVQITVPLTHLSGADASAVRAFVPSGAGFTYHLPQFTKLDATQTNVIFVVPTASALINVGHVTYTLAPAATSRGDFEDRIGSSIPPTGVDIGIPEIDIELRSEPIVAKTRKLKAVWTPELAQDLNAYHSIDAEAELTAMLSQHISLEIDLELLEMLIVNAATTEYWSAKIGTVWNGSSFAADSNISAQAWTQMTWNQTLGSAIQKASNRIHQLTLRGGANFVVVSPDVATILETIPGFTAKTDGNQADFGLGVSAVGSFQNRFQVYKNPYLMGNLVLLGFRGSSFLETGAAYCPYIPLIMTPLVYDPQNFTPRRGVLTRYAKKMLRNEFYAKLFVHGLTA